MATVKIPGIGPVDRKWVYAGGAVIVGIVGYAYWVRSRTDDSVADYREFPAGTDYAYDGGVDEYTNPGGSQEVVDEDYLPTPSNNAEWSQMAISSLVDHGYDPIAASMAIGRYMLRQTLSSSDADMVRAAVAMLGHPPSGEYPIETSPTPDPDPEPEPEPDPEVKMKKVTGLKYRSRSGNHITIQWNPVPGAEGYRVYRSGVVGNVGHSWDTSHRFQNLSRNKTYRFYVRAEYPGNRLGPKSSTKSFKTHKQDKKTQYYKMSMAEGIK